MRLYSGMSEDFISDNVHNSIAEKLRDAYISYFRTQPGPGEVNAWRNSLKSVSMVFQHGKLLDHGVILEYQLPLTSKRLDCMVLGRGPSQYDHAVVIELKQWEQCEPAEGENEILTWVGGAQRERLHPSAQVQQYHRYLQDNHMSFYEPDRPVQLSSCSYLHNYVCRSGDPLLEPKFTELLKTFPMFSSQDVDQLTEFLHQRLSRGQGREVLDRVENGGFRPSRKLMQHVAKVIKEKSEYILLDEQLVVYDRIMALVSKGFRSNSKSIVIVKGGPGTGKSVIALNVMADLLRRGINAHYATGSRAFTETLRRIIGARGSEQFRYFHNYASAKPEEVDVLICDEAHRIRETSNDRFHPNKSNLPQVEELFDASKVGVYFVDDKQVVRPNEIGSSTYVKANAVQRGFAVHEYQLETQFRCGGSEVFVNWVNNTLGIERTPNVIWEGAEGFEFRIFDSPDTLEAAIREKSQRGQNARLTAGYCWYWSKANPDGTLVNDVVIGDYSRPWNARPESTRLAKNIPKAPLWAYDPNGIDQIGCIYTTQGFEFDYVGVIFGTDLRFDMDRQEWIADKKASFDGPVKRSKDKFIDLTRNTYRVLLSRGMKGCYVYFQDKDTERFFKTRMDVRQVKKLPAEAKTIRIIPPEDADALAAAFVSYLPVYSLQAAAGVFSQPQEVQPQGWIEWTDSRLDRDMFVARVQGRSMLPKINDGDYCIFRFNPKGSRQGRIVLAQYRGPEDPETGGSYTVKQYYSEKKQTSEDQWQHQRILLKPLNSEFKPIEVDASSAEDIRIVAELIHVIGQ